MAALRPQCYRVVPITAPTDEERAHHYLWRFWRHVSRTGRVTIFDRSWYGRVLVERVEGLATETEWKRTYAEIRQFEEELTIRDHPGEYWLHITSDEQERRFRNAPGRLQELEADRGGLAQPEEVGGTSSP